MGYTIWNPWKGCNKYSIGCLNCYIHLGQKKRGEVNLPITLTDDFYKPVKRDKLGNYIVKTNTLVYTCFSSDFLLEEMDQYRKELWAMIKERSDLKFMFLTKRIARLSFNMPDDWEDGYDNVIIGVSVENQKTLDERISIFKSLKVKHKIIACQPLLEEIDLSGYLDSDIKEVVVGGEAASYTLARPLNYDWVLKIRNACMAKNVNFTFRQVGSVFIKDNVVYKIPWKKLAFQAKEANINYSNETL